MVAVAAIARERSAVSNGSEQEMTSFKMKASPALSFVSTVAFSDAAEMWDFSDDEDDHAGVSSMEPPWGAIGACHAPAFACLDGDDKILDGDDKILVNGAGNGNGQWGNVGARLAEVMKEAAEMNDLEEPCGSESVHCAREQAWQLVGLRLSHVFSSFVSDGESTLERQNCIEGDLDVLGIKIKDYPDAHSESHQRWHAVGSGLAAVFKSAAT